jgi:hypothetical protein
MNFRQGNTESDTEALHNLCPNLQPVSNLSYIKVILCFSFFMFLYIFYGRFFYWHMSKCPATETQAGYRFYKMWTVKSRSGPFTTGNGPADILKKA